eukprot:GEMP01053533.1.p1 GENE.GEMP01053533.1~~GEMP01053533.1.p1  ORF type:complete len:124 (-),score=5.60 GEMP01053533.1:38-409(-)
MEAQSTDFGRHLSALKKNADGTAPNVNKKTTSIRARVGLGPGLVIHVTLPMWPERVGQALFPKFDHDFSGLQKRRFVKTKTGTPTHPLAHSLTSAFRLEFLGPERAPVTALAVYNDLVVYSGL